MRIESIKVRNYKVLQNVEVKEISPMAVFLGKNGVGKRTFFDVFAFLQDALQSNIRVALAKRGGFQEVISRGEEGDIEFEIRFRSSEDEPIITYQLSICLLDNKKPAIKKEIMWFRRGQMGDPWKVLEFAFGEGVAADGDLIKYEDIRLAERSRKKLDSPDILAIKGLGQFKEFIAVNQLRRLIEDWYVSDFHIEDARGTKDAGYSERISTSGDNLALVAKFMYDNHRELFLGTTWRLWQSLCTIITENYLMKSWKPWGKEFLACQRWRRRKQRMEELFCGFRMATLKIPLSPDLYRMEQ